VIRTIALSALVLALAPVASPRAGERARCPLPDPVALVGTPPAPGSLEADADLAAVLRAQRTRTPEEVARAASEEELSLEDFAAVLGTTFDVGRHPRTEALLGRAVAASRPCVAGAKAAHARPRPWVADPRVAPSAAREQTASFPSGHSTRGALLAAVLGELAPDRREALLRRGAQIGDDRVIAGVHFPSDVAAGQRLGAAVARALLADPAFRAALDEVRAREWGR
jgi:membrane-associated phospholipid phosphatase